MRRISPAGKEILAMIRIRDNATIETIYKDTTRPKDLIRELVQKHKGRYITDNENGLSLTDRGIEQAKSSQFNTEQIEC